MTWPSKFRNLPVGEGKAGFTLLEVLIAFAIVASTMVAVMATLARATTEQAQRLRDLWLTEYARSVLEEYSETWPEMARSGQADGGWHWELAEVKATPNPPGPLDADLGYVSVTVKVWNDWAPDETAEATTLLARRRR